MGGPDTKDVLPILVSGLWVGGRKTWCSDIIPALRRLRQKDSKFKAYIVRHYFKRKLEKKKKSKTLAS